MRSTWACFEQNTWHQESIEHRTFKKTWNKDTEQEIKLKRSSDCDEELKTSTEPKRRRCVLQNVDKSDGDGVGVITSCWKQDTMMGSNALLWGKLPFQDPMKLDSPKLK